MKFNINGYSQTRLIENELDVVDSLILRVIADMYVSSSKKITYKIIEKEKYMWCSYGYLLEQIPIIGTKRTLIRKIDKLIEKEILKKKVITQQKGKQGKFLYLVFDKKYSELTEYQPSDKMSTGLGNQVTKCHQPNDKMSSDQVTKCHIKDSSINNYSIKHSTDTKLDTDKPNTEKPESNFDNSSVKRDMVFRLIGDLNLSVDKIINTGKSIERIKEVFKFARNNNKGEGWIVSALKEDYKIENKPKFIIKKRKVFDFSEQGYHFEEYQVPCS